MKYLLDTHIIMWALINDRRIPSDLKEKLLDKNNQVFYSTVSTWEVEIKHQKIKDFRLTGEQLCFLCDQNDIINLPIKNCHIAKLKEVVSKDFRVKHNDPFDKMLLAQAIEENMFLITHDHKFEIYKHNNIIIII